MTKSTKCTKVKALDSQPLCRSDPVANVTNDETILNPNRRRSSDVRNRKNGLSKPSKMFKVASLNCRTLQTESSIVELNKLLHSQSIDITCIQEHRFVHKPADPDIVARNLGSSTLFTASAKRNDQGAAIHGVGIAINSKLLPILLSVKKINERIVVATFKGNPKTVIVSCYSPHNSLPEEMLSDFYDDLCHTVDTIPPHHMLIIGGDMNAKTNNRFSLHTATDRNGVFLQDFTNQFNLIIGNTSFQKPKVKLWTYRSPTGSLSQIDYIIYRKRWRNSVLDCQAFSSSHPVGSDHRIVSAKIKLSVRRPPPQTMKKLYWQYLPKDKNLSNRVDNSIKTQFDNLPRNQQTYSSFVKIANKIGSQLLPKRDRSPPTNSADALNVVAARKATLRASTRAIQTAQINLRNTYDRSEDTRINNILKSFEHPASSSSVKHAWDLVKKISGKKARSVIFIEGENRLKCWETHFKNLLNSEPHNQTAPDPIRKIFDELNEIPSGLFSKEEIVKATQQMKNGKAPGSDGLPPEFWKLPRTREKLHQFCNETFLGDRPPEWGIANLIPVPKKGDLTKTDNYRGIALSQTAAKVYNRCILNRIRPVIDKVLRPNQNGFRQGRSTSAHVLALRRIVEELKNHKKEAVISFIDFRKAFDSVNRSRMFEILSAYGIPDTIVNAIKILYKDTTASVVTPEGETEPFTIKTGVLQGDPLAPFLFIIVLDYALRTSITSDHGFTLKRRQSRRHQTERLSDLDYADDIALIEDEIIAAQELLTAVEKACQDVGLFLNAPKTKYMHINPSSNSQLISSDGSIIECVDDFRYLGSFSDTDHDMEVRIGQAWSALHSLSNVWKASIKKSTKTKVFKACVESILLYGSESWTLNVKRSKRLDGIYTKMLRSIYNMSWRQHHTIKQIYGNLPRITSIVRQRRLKLAGHVSRHNEPAGKLIIWRPDAPRRIGRPYVTLKSIIEEETGLAGKDLLTAMSDRKRWKEDFVNASPNG